MSKRRILRKPKTDLLTECREADPDFDRERAKVTAYEFSNGRKFEEPKPSS